MRICAACRAENSDEASFCSRCGTSLDREPGPVAERKLVTILFADIVGSTGIGAQLDPERLREVLDAYVAAMREVIEAEGGTIEKFIGDAVMAVFGAPVAHEDDPTRAVRAALGIHRRLVELNRTLEEDHGIRLEVRVGVNTGEVFAVTDAPPDESMVTGDAVNVAARLEQSAEAGAVLVSERTARAVRGFHLESIGPLELRGKEEPIEAFIAVGETSAGELGAGRPTLPMIGRRADLSLLLSTWARVVSEAKPARVTILGEPGVGKTRLMEETEAALAGETPELNVVRGRCLPYGDAIVYWPLAEILKRFAGVSDGDPADVASSRVEEALLKLLWGTSPDPERAAAALAFTVGLHRAGSFLEALAPTRVQAEASAAWRAFFSALAGAAPLLVVLEDIHWADPALLELLEVVSEGVDGPALFLCASRPEIGTRRPEWGAGRNSSSIFLEPLPSDDAERLLDGLLSSEGVVADRSLREELVERTGGNPFFLEEVVRHLRDRGPGGEVPDTVQAVLAARIDMLPTLDKRVLQCAAVVGKEFWAGAVEALTDRAATDVRTRLGTLEQRGLIRRSQRSELSGEPEYAFRHVLTRDVAYESLPRRDRAFAHAAVGEWIERRAGHRAREFAELLAHHYLTAFHGARRAAVSDVSASETLRSNAFRHSLLASDAARSRLALEAAKVRAEAALNIADGSSERAAALGALGRARLHAVEGDLAWESFREAASLLIEEPSTPAAQVVAACLEALELITRQAGAMRARLSPAQALPLLDEALARAKDDDDAATRLRIVQAFWPYSFEAGRGTEKEELEARARGEAAFEMAARSGRSDLASAALDGVGIYYMERGLYGDWWPVIQRRLDLVDSLSDSMEVGDILASAAWCVYGIGDYRSAEGFADRGVRATTDVEPLMALYCLDWRAVAHVRLGDWDACLRDVDEAADVMGERRTEPPGFACDHLAAAAFVHDERGDVEVADDLLAVIEWVQRAEERSSPPLVVWAARVLARRGQFDEARARLERPELAGEHYATGSVLEAWCDIVAEQEAWELVEPIGEEARARSAEGGLRALPGYADRLDGMRALAGGDHPRAIGFLRAAVERFDALEAAWEAARTRLHLAAALAANGDRDGAALALGEAGPALARSGSIRELERAAAIAARLEGGP